MRGRERNIQFKSKLTLVIIVVIASFLAAFIGQMVINNLTTIPSLSPDERFIIRPSADRRTQLRKAIKEIYQTEVSAFIEVYRQLDEMKRVAKGVVLTNDGWLVVIAENEEFNAENWDYARLESGEFISILNFVIDPASSLVFIQIESDSLTPVTLGSEVPSTPIEEYLIVRYQGIIANSSFITSQLSEELYLNSDMINKYAVMSAGETGDGIYNEEAEMIGLVVGHDSGGNARVINASAIQAALEKILKNGEISRPSLGIHYIDLAFQPVSDAFTEGLHTGAFVTNKLGQPPVNVLLQKSPAFKAGVRMNDIIISVDGDIINEHNSLSDYIIEFKPGDTIKLGIIRNGQPVSVDVELE